jgi:tetratricopeptide (TPR) repeat protein
LSINEQILSLAGMNVTENDLRNSAIGCGNAGLYLEAAAYWLKFSDKFLLGFKREDLDLLIPAFGKAGFTIVTQNGNHKFNLSNLEATEQVLRDFAAVCSKFDMKKHFADCWKKIIEKAGENATLEEIRITGLAYNEAALSDANLYASVVIYMGLLVKKSGKEVLESDLRIYANACCKVDFKEGYDAWKKLIEKVGDAATSFDIRKMALISTNAGFDLEAIKYWEILLNNFSEDVTALDLMSIAQAYEKNEEYEKALECLKTRLFKLGEDATIVDFKYVIRLCLLKNLHSEAVKYYEEIVKIEGQYATLNDLRDLANLYYIVKDYKKAIACWKRVLEKAGTFATHDDILNYKFALLQDKSS